jgi:WD40 repeat protein
MVGGRLASCGDEGAIQIWDVESGQHLRILRGDRPSERLPLTGIPALTQTEIATWRALGAVEDEVHNSPSTRPRSSHRGLLAEKEGRFQGVPCDFLPLGEQVC